MQIFASEFHSPLWGTFLKKNDWFKISGNVQDESGSFSCVYKDYHLSGIVWAKKEHWQQCIKTLIIFKNLWFHTNIYTNLSLSLLDEKVIILRTVIKI